MLQQDIIDAGGSYDNKALMSKIIRGLPGRYSSFVDQHYLLQNVPGLSGSTFHDLTGRLLSFESQIKDQDDRRKTPYTARGSKDEEDKGDKQRLRCSYIPCGKWGHSEYECRMKKRHEEDKTKTKSVETKEIKKEERTKIVAMSFSPDLNTFRNKILQSQNKMTSAVSSMNPFRLLDDDLADLCLQSREPKESEVEEERVGDWTADRTSYPVSPINSLYRNNRVHTAGMMTTGTTSLHKTDWIVDTGASMHLVNDRSMFKEFHTAELTIGTANNENSMEILGGGTVELSILTSSGDVVDFELSECAYAPSSRCNLLSISLLETKAKLCGKWGNSIFTLETNGGTEVGHAVLKDTLYHLQVRQQIDTLSGDLAALSTVDYNDPVWQWHRRLGHLSFDSMKKLSIQSTGMTLTTKQIAAKVKAICPVCATIRAINKIPRDPARRQFNAVGDLLIADSWGPYPIEGLNRVRYALFVIDDATRYIWVQFF